MQKRNIILITSILILLLILIVFRSYNKKEQNIFIETTKVKKGSVSNIVTATGTIEAIKTVAVGTQVSGEIRKIYVDYNSEVKAGQLLAELDRKPLTTALTIAEASLDDAKAEMTYQNSNYNRIKALFDKNLVAESDYDQALYNYERAKTSLKTAQLNYDKAQINLEYAYIYSPINGVVLSRAVDEGQTVAASFSTPTLFSIANDLTQMQVEASIDEADIGQVKNNQRVLFTVDAYPDEKFEGKVIQIRLEPEVTSNVVTYTVIVEAPNPEKKLMPGMTASITIFVEEANNVLVVPSKALLFNPDPEILGAYLKSLPGNEHPEIDFEKSPIEHNSVTPQQNPNMNDNVYNETTHIWVKKGNGIHPVQVIIGINNDIDVEIKSGVSEGEEVVTALKTDKINTRQANQPSANSPFMPKPPSRRNKNN